MNAVRRRIVLVGAGHAHVQVLRRWADSPVRGADVVLVVDRDHAVYSGMVPGFLAGDYSLDQTRIPVLPLARAAGAEVLRTAARLVDPVRRTIELVDGGSLAWDIASLNVGSTVRGLDVPGVREHVLATRPIGSFAAALDRRVASLAGRAARVAVVGGGAAGVEIAFTIHARLAATGPSPLVFLVCGPDGLLAGYADRVRRVVTTEAAARGITIAATSRVRSVDAAGIAFAGGRLEADLVVWATGAAAPALVADSPLLHAEHGFVRVRPTLEVPGARGLFAAGDCATIDGAEWMAKAGVYAVREGPVLEANLRAAAGGHALTVYRPQRDFLSLLNLGGRRALATKWGLVVTGRVPWLWKDRIDRAFVEHFRTSQDHQQDRQQDHQEDRQQDHQEDRQER